MIVRRTFMIVLFIPLLTGCWSRTEINDLAIVVGVAVDKVDDKNIQVALQIAIPRGLGTAGGAQGSSSKNSTILLSAKGETVMGVFRIIQEKLPREVFVAHSRVIIIGEELARDDVAPILDYFSRSRQAHLRSYILITKGKAIDILKLNPRLEPILAEEVREQEKTSVGVQIRVRDFLKSLLTDGEDPVAAQISINPLEEPKGKGKSEKTSALNGAAVFRDGKLVGWLNDIEARGILWLSNDIKSGVMSVMIPVDKGGGKVSAYLLNGSTKIKPIIHNGKLTIKIEASGDISISENTSSLDITDPKVLQSIQPIFEKDISDRICLTIDKVQKEYNSDVFGFGQAVYRSYPKKWEDNYKNNWYDIFPNLEVEVTSNIVVKGTGYSTKSMSIPDVKK